MKLKAIPLLLLLPALMVLVACGGGSQTADTPVPKTTVMAKVKIQQSPTAAPTTRTMATLTPVPTSTVVGIKPTDPSTPADDGVRSKGQGKGNGGDSRSQIANWRELYEIIYTASCIDERFGTSVTREFQTGKRGPTDEERKLLEGCDIESARGPVPKNDKDEMDVRERIEGIKARSGSWTNTGDPTKDQYTVGYRPTADEWRCGVAAVGVAILRNIRAGKHSITDEENQKLTPCFRPSPDNITHPYAQLWEGHCIPLDLLLEVIDYYRPSWEQLECHLEGLERYEMPKQVRYLQLDDPFGIRSSKAPLFAPLWDRVMTDPYYADLKMNFSPSMGNRAMPPSFTWEYNDINCLYSRRDEDGNLVLDDYWLDESLRGAAIAWIMEKKKGRRIYADTDMCGTAFIVQGNIDDHKMPAFTSVDEYKEWALNITIPKFIVQAKAAEKVKAETMQLGGLKAEVEVVFSQDQFLGTLPPSEQVELAQWTLDALIPEVRKHFNGMIWVASAANYDNGHPDFPMSGMVLSAGPHWKELSFAAADYVSFTLTTTCDYRHMERELDIAFGAYMEIVQRDNVPWGIFPGITERKYGPTYGKACKDEFIDKRVAMEELLISRFAALPVQPYFLWGLNHPPRDWTKDDEGDSPTEADASKGDWQLYSLDVLHSLATNHPGIDEAVRAMRMKYALKHLIE